MMANGGMINGTAGMLSRTRRIRMRHARIRWQSQPKKMKIKEKRSFLSAMIMMLVLRNVV
jgi:hypothetical protein